MPKVELLSPIFIPLQSGSNELLKKMKRRYLRELYIDRVNQIKNLMPNACIGADVIVGFPGESDKSFLETYGLISIGYIIPSCFFIFESPILGY